MDGPMDGLVTWRVPDTTLCASPAEKINDPVSMQKKNTTQYYWVNDYKYIYFRWF